MSNFEERREARIDRLRDRAAKHREEETRRDKEDRRYSDLTNGQPILIGHHSEKKHRGLLKRMHGNYAKAREHGAAAEELERRAKSAENNRAIFSDDPTAIDQLEEKIEKIEEQSEYYKKINKIVRSKPKNTITAEKRQALSKYGISEKNINELFTPDYGPPGISPYIFTNLSSERRRLEQRRDELKSREGLESKTEQIGAVELEVDLEDNRVRLHFPGKPDEEFRRVIKSFGFRWSPRNQAWQRQYNPSAKNKAIQIAQDFNRRAEQ